jgi:hypothetical protein
LEDVGNLRSAYTYGISKVTGQVNITTVEACAPV